VTGFSFDYDTILRYYDDGARYFDLRRLDPREDTARREIGGDLDYPYLGQSSRYFDLFVDYVTEYIRHYYPDDRSFAGGPAPARLVRHPRPPRDRGIIGYVPALTRDSLIRLCALFLYTVSVEHEDNTMWNYAMFLPATVRADGRGQSVGEVQAVVNFELLISSATNRLMNDASHVALDARGAAIMRGLQARLSRLHDGDGARAAPPLAHPAPRPRGQHLGVNQRSGGRSRPTLRAGGLRPPVVRPEAETEA
jgi:hypothetical protein